jgi:hypothetical protein
VVISELVNLSAVFALFQFEMSVSCNSVQYEYEYQKNFSENYGKILISVFLNTKMKTKIRKCYIFNPSDFGPHDQESNL